MTATAMDFEQARFNMVEQQIRTWEVLDQDVLDLLFTVRREDFVPPEYRTLAFADLELPLPGGQRMWAPKIEARVLQSLKLARGESVLGDRHRQRLLHRAAREPCRRRDDRRDRSRSWQRAAAAKLARQGFRQSCAAKSATARAGWGNELYDAIVLTGSTPLLPEQFLQQLKPAAACSRSSAIRR